MGRVKLQIKKIENTTNRQVTFSKRRNGLIKKAYELSVLCDVDVALIMFSPSGRLSLFSGNRSIEEIMARYVNLPEHERGRPSSRCLPSLMSTIIDNDLSSIGDILCDWSVMVPGDGDHKASETTISEQTRRQRKAQQRRQKM
ncbi:hypothetical protein RHGRI_021784 [Rhododendron griersonianum]|uniref:MADS-box domain-containing protein n=1 Tax=Rhododendron griersonianum TaxID=479676 RepID=A0AAV6JLQ6_9ERIC|nr:hypothetical protein RHGRI_021784 [Rhododendron griersonianum]